MRWLSLLVHRRFVVKSAQWIRNDATLIRSTRPDYGHNAGGYVLYGKDDDISSEERQEVDQLCQRIFEIEQELHHLAYVARHLEDDVAFELNFNDLIGYGFEAE